MATRRIMVSPVYDAPFVVPFIFPRESDVVPFAKLTDSWGQVYVMGDQQCLSGTKPNDKPLVSAPLEIIWKNPDYLAFAFNLEITFLILKGMF